MTSSTRTFIFSVLGLFVATIILLSTAVAYAASTFSAAVEMSGYAWSSNVGWISLNCSNDSSCGISNYKVSINPDYTLTGYAWSSNVGWIKFGGLSGMPSGSTQASLTSDHSKLQGWVRACSATTNGACSGALNPDGGGWDGWISLNCSNHSCSSSNYAVSVGVGSLGSYAWGSEVVGWVSFGTAGFSQPCTPSLACNANNDGYSIVDQWCEPSSTGTCSTGEYCIDSVGCQVLDIAYTFKASRPVIRSGQTVTLDWSVNGTDVTSCQVTGNNGDIWSGLTDEAAGGAITSALVRQGNIYTLSCIPTGGGAYYDLGTVEIKLVPVSIES